jgi:60 kDa SS-A/Ro ribonucleoprotein
MAPIPGREEEMDKNPAGGYSFSITDMSRLRRFLILGVEGNTFYQSQRELVKQNAESAERAIKENPRAVVDEVVSVLTEGRSFRPDASLFVLAMVAAYNVNKPEDKVAADARSYALSKLPEVANTPYQLYVFANYVQSMRGWGRSLRNAFSRWYEQSPLDRLAMHAWKYKQREGFSHRDLLRLSHPSTKDELRNGIYQYMADKSDLSKGLSALDGDVPSPLDQIAAAEELLKLQGNDKATIKRATDLITKYRLTHEAVPGHLKNEKAVWEALAQDMPVIAMVRNLAKMTSVGYIDKLSKGAQKVIEALENENAIRRSKAHPMQFLIAAKQYEQGRGDKGGLTWNPNRGVIDALDTAFHLSFGNVEKTGKRFIIAGDDSGSMSGYGWMSRGSLAGGMSPAEAAAAMMMVNYRVEPNTVMIGYSDDIREIPASKRMTLNSLLKHFGRGGGTNTALPAHYALENKLDVDVIVSYTDNCTWAGGFYGWGRSARSGHVTEVLDRLQDRLGHEVKWVNCAMEANSSSDVDPNKTNMLELVGLDANTPRIIGEFASGRL